MGRRQFEFANEGGNLIHCIDRVNFRSRGAHPANLKRIQKNLNENVPLDWRLTKFSTDFLVQDMDTGILLLGEQYRLATGIEVYKNFNTVLEHGGNTKDKFNVKKYGEATAARPNLVISNQEIYSRQYQKRSEYKNDMKRAQYFRMHKLTKEGLLDEHKWLKWIPRANNGRKLCEWIEKAQIPEDYHGDDYWELPIRKR